MADINLDGYKSEYYWHDHAATEAQYEYLVYLTDQYGNPDWLEPYAQTVDGEKRFVLNLTKGEAAHYISALKRELGLPDNPNSRFGKRKRYDKLAARNEEITALARDGHYTAEIAAWYGLSKGTIADIVSRYMGQQDRMASVRSRANPEDCSCGTKHPENIECICKYGFRHTTRKSWIDELETEVVK